jgi:DNA-binding transcriptional MerR regulator
MRELAIPNKLFFRIGEVCKLLSLEPYVLRFWEKEFPTLTPTKGANGRRMYRKKDVEMVITIRHLLYTQGFTIAGAKKVIASGGTGASVSEVFRPKASVEIDHKVKPTKPTFHEVSHEKLAQVKRDLREILTILNRRC